MRLLLVVISISMALVAGAPSSLRADDPPPAYPDTDTGGGNDKADKKADTDSTGDGDQSGGITSSKTSSKATPKTGSTTVKQEGSSIVRP